MRPGVEEASPGRPLQARLKRAETAKNASVRRFFLNGGKKRPVGAGQGTKNDRKKPACAGGGGGGWDLWPEGTRECVWDKLTAALSPVAGSLTPVLRGHVP